MEICGFLFGIAVLALFAVMYLIPWYMALPISLWAQYGAGDPPPPAEIKYSAGQRRFLGFVGSLHVILACVLTFVGAFYWGDLTRDEKWLLAIFIAGSVVLGWVNLGHWNKKA